MQDDTTTKVKRIDLCEATANLYAKFQQTARAQQAVADEAKAAEAEAQRVAALYAEAVSNEVWRPVVGFESQYEVSSLGDVYSLRARRVMRTWRMRSGYPAVSLTKKLKSKINRTVHKLVAEAFMGPCPDGKEVCHNDGDPENNWLGNLRYDTKSANGLDVMRHRIIKAHGKAKSP